MRKWRPSRKQAREFAKNMENEEYRNAYLERKALREKKRRDNSMFDYDSAGGRYIPTQAQYDAAVRYIEERELTMMEETACNDVIYGYTCKEPIHHDHIHIVNEMRRSEGNY